MGDIDRLIDEFGGSKTLISVPGARLRELLSENNISKVDFLSLDIEGGELDVIKTILEDGIDVQLCTIENRDRNSSLWRLMRKHGYHLIAKVASDEVYFRSARSYLATMFATRRLLRPMT
ncbi:MAG: hypothetical protein HKN13_10165 [Rhodothermales bacterium]|nr:hypothetical protein [Rhodothermales bacterium]